MHSFHILTTFYRLFFIINYKEYTGLFISPSGISDPCGTVAGMVTPKGSMSTEGETLQICPTLQVLDMCTLGDAADVNPVIKFLRQALQHLATLFTVHTIFRHDYPLAVEPASTPRSLVQKKLWEILYLLICSFLPCLSWLLRSRVRKFRRDLWITLYKHFNLLILFSL